MMMMKIELHKKECDGWKNERRKCDLMEKVCEKEKEAKEKDIERNFVKVKTY